MSGPVVLSFRQPRATERVLPISADSQAIAAAELAAQAIVDKKGSDLVLLDVSELVVLTDLFLIATGTSNRHVKTLVEEVERVLKDAMGRKPLRREGEDHARWVLLDYGDLVVHVFDEETRAYYELERLWADAPQIDLELVQAEAR